MAPDPGEVPRDDASEPATTWRRGMFVELDGLLAVIVGLPEDGDAPEDHVALWFGDPRTVRRSQGGAGGAQPEVWTVPSAYCRAAATAIVRH